MHCFKIPAIRPKDRMYGSGESHSKVVAKCVRSD